LAFSIFLASPVDLSGLKQFGTPQTLPQFHPNLTGEEVPICKTKTGPGRATQKQDELYDLKGLTKLYGSELSFPPREDDRDWSKYLLRVQD
jgi:hypothetical protein